MGEEVTHGLLNALMVLTAAYSEGQYFGRLGVRSGRRILMKVLYDPQSLLIPLNRQAVERIDAGPSDGVERGQRRWLVWKGSLLRWRRGCRCAMSVCMFVC